MSHARKTIRSAIATILKASPAAWATSAVMETRIQSPRQIWPYLLVFADSETSVSDVVNLAGVYERTAIISVVCLIRLPGSGDTQTIEDKMDTMAAEVETKLTTTALIASGAKSIYLTATKLDVILEDNGVDHAEVNMTYHVKYFTAEGAPETLI